MKIEKKAAYIYKLKKNLIIRIIAWPYINFARFIKREMYKYSQDSKKIQSMKNINYGKRCFIVGNGPSLKAADLNRINNEKCFASNRIYGMFNETKWRPNYYFCTDVDLLRIENSKLINIGKEYDFLEIKAKRFIKTKDKSNLIYFAEKFHHYIRWYKPQKFQVSEDVSKFFCVSGTVTLHAIQMAIYMGFKEIYLLGVDHFFAKQIDANGKVHKSKVRNYFDSIEDYTFAVYNIDSVEYGYNVTRDYCDKHNIKIYNATRGGKLEVFERIDFDSLFL